jgi:S-formylglutathione hydrolase FrmB
VTKKYEVYLPGGYDASQLHYPVITMLHGLGGDETNWLRHGHLAETADALHLQAIVVMPDGDGSFYVDADAARPMDACLADKPPFNGAERPETYCVKTPRYETYITRDLLADVEAHYRVLPGKDARGIGGLSMGGFGALELAMRHPDLYAAAASHSGLASLLYAGPHPYAPGKAVHAESAADWGKKYPDKMRALVRGIFGPSMAFYRDHDPVTLAAHLSPGTLAIYLDCGTEDDFGFEDHAAELHDVLTSRGIDHTFALVPGHHTFDLWRARLPESLRFFSKSLSAPKALP